MNSHTPQDTAPSDNQKHSDMPSPDVPKELREKILKAGTVKKGMVTFSQKIFSNNTTGPVTTQSQEIVEISIDDLMQLFTQELRQLLEQKIWIDVADDKKRNRTKWRLEAVPVAIIEQKIKSLEGEK